MSKHIAKMFNEQQSRQAEGFKTGFFESFCNDEQRELANEKGCGCIGAGVVDIDWFTTRTKDHKPVIRVQWVFPSYASRKVYSRCGCYSKREKTWECIRKEQRFEFSAEGLAAAVEFAESL